MNNEKCICKPIGHCKLVEARYQRENTLAKVSHRWLYISNDIMKLRNVLCAHNFASMTQPSLHCPN
jgi:hypothetical protein